MDLELSEMGQRHIKMLDHMRKMQKELERGKYFTANVNTLMTLRGNKTNIWGFSIFDLGYKDCILRLKAYLVATKNELVMWAKIAPTFLGGSGKG